MNLPLCRDMGIRVKSKYSEFLGSCQCPIVQLNKLTGFQSKLDLFHKTRIEIFSLLYP